MLSEISLTLEKLIAAAHPTAVFLGTAKIKSSSHCAPEQKDHGLNPAEDCVAATALADALLSSKMGLSFSTQVLITRGGQLWLELERNLLPNSVPIITQQVIITFS